MRKKQIIEFFERLEGKEGCNFRKVNGKGTWNCKGGMDKSLSIKILRKMKVSDTEMVELLIECDKTGGHCDCEIIFNSKGKFL